MMGQQALPLLLPAIIEDLAISPFIAGTALTGMWILYAMFQYPGGQFADQLTSRTVLVAGLVIALAGYLTLVFAVTYPLFLLGISAAGIGGGIFLVAMRTTLAQRFVEHRGRAFGINLAAGMVGNVVAAGIAVVVVSVTTWRVAFLPVVLGLVVIILALHLWMNEAYQIARVNLNLQATGRRVFGSSDTRRLVLVFSLYAFTWQGSISFLPTFLRLERGFSTVFAGGSFALLFIVGLVVMPAAGGLSDQLNRIHVGAGALVLGACGLGLVVLALTPVLLVGGVIAFAIGLMAYPPVMQAYLMDSFSDTSMGGDFGAFRTIYTGIGGLGPSFVGFVAEYHTYASAFVGLIGCLLVATVIVLIGTRPDS
jgi:MFS family permease